MSQNIDCQGLHGEKVFSVVTLLVKVTLCLALTRQWALESHNISITQCPPGLHPKVSQSRSCCSLLCCSESLCFFSSSLEHFPSIFFQCLSSSHIHMNKSYNPRQQTMFFTLQHVSLKFLAVWVDWAANTMGNGETGCRNGALKTSHCLLSEELSLEATSGV